MEIFAVKNFGTLGGKTSHKHSLPQYVEIFKKSFLSYVQLNVSEIQGSLEMLEILRRSYNIQKRYFYGFPIRCVNNNEANYLGGRADSHALPLTCYCP